LSFESDGLTHNSKLGTQNSEFKTAKDMRPKLSNSSAERTRRPARDVIDAVLENMRKNLEPLKYSILAPSRYLIYLHPAEYARLEGIIAILQEQTIRALSEEVAARNKQSILRQCTQRILGERKLCVENPSGEWSIEFLPDPDGDIAEGDILVDSELLLPANPELGIGERTRLVRTVHSGQQTTGSVAQIVYDDDTGHHSYDVRGSVTIGRGGAAYPVDVKIVSSVDVSREHARIRRDSHTGAFFLVDLSALGTTLNGRHVPRGYDEVNGIKQENGTETLLPNQAQIGLADTVYLNFCRVR
jgi:pSer/pThr/pTyr-binding forkhead associated (FHA) protein